MFDLFRGPHATLLSFGMPAAGSERPASGGYSITAPEGPAGPDQLVAVDGRAFADYAAKAGTRVLVRPDGYLARHRQG